MLMWAERGCSLGEGRWEKVGDDVFCGEHLRTDGGDSTHGGDGGVDALGWAFLVSPTVHVLGVGGLRWPR
jgi:hypothetical protein